MDVGTIGETAGIGSISPRLSRTIFQENHTCLLLLNEIHAKRSFLRIGWRMPTCRSRVHAAYLPFSSARPLQCSNVLVTTIDKDEVVKNCSVRQGFQITFRYKPFFFERSRQDAAKATFTSLQIGDGAITPVTFGSQRISQKDKEVQIDNAPHPMYRLHDDRHYVHSDAPAELHYSNFDNSATRPSGQNPAACFQYKPDTYASPPI